VVAATKGWFFNRQFFAFMRVLIFVAEELSYAHYLVWHHQVALAYAEKGDQVLLSLPAKASKAPKHPRLRVRYRSTIKDPIFPSPFNVIRRNLLARWIHPRFPLRHGPDLLFDPKLALVFSSPFIDGEALMGSWLINVLRARKVPLYKFCQNSPRFADPNLLRHRLAQKESLVLWEKIYFSSEELWDHEAMRLAHPIKAELWDHQERLITEKEQDRSSMQSIRVYAPQPVQAQYFAPFELVQWAATEPKVTRLIFVKHGAHQADLSDYAQLLKVPVEWVNPEESVRAELLWLRHELVNGISVEGSIPQAQNIQELHAIMSSEELASFSCSWKRPSASLPPFAAEAD
jgi:hypothetical protein